MTGWNMPPGCSPRDIPGNFDAPCDVCGKFCDDCVCPECETCGEPGNPKCYYEHGLKLNKAQIKARSERRVLDLQTQIADEGQFQAWLEGNPSDYTMELKDLE